MKGTKKFLFFINSIDSVSFYKCRLERQFKSEIRIRNIPSSPEWQLGGILFLFSATFFWFTKQVFALVIGMLPDVIRSGVEHLLIWSWFSFFNFVLGSRGDFSSFLPKQRSSRHKIGIKSIRQGARNEARLMTSLSHPWGTRTLHWIIY